MRRLRGWSCSPSYSPPWSLRFVAKLLFDRLARQLERTNNLYDDALLDAARKPIGWAIWSFGVLFAAEYALRGAESDLVAYADPVRDVIAIVLSGVVRHPHDPFRRGTRLRPRATAAIP